MIETPVITEQEAHKPEDVAAAFFKREKPNLKALLSTMTQKQIRRFVMHVVSYPLIDEGDTLQTPLEKRAAYLMNEMMMNKMIMQLAYENQKLMEAQANEQQTENTGV